EAEIASSVPLFEDGQFEAMLAFSVWYATQRLGRISPFKNAPTHPVFPGVCSITVWQRTLCRRGRYSGLRKKGVPALSIDSDQACRRAETVFKKQQQVREGQQAMAEYQAKLDAMREKTARLRAQRMARDGANKTAPPTNTKGAA